MKRKKKKDLALKDAPPGTEVTIISPCFWMAPKQHRPSPHPAYLEADAAETECDVSGLHAEECPHPYPEYLTLRLHGPKAKEKNVSFS